MKPYSLVGINANAFNIMAYVKSCMQKERKSQEEIKNYLNDAMSSNYDHLLYVSNEMIDKLNNESI